jgi:RNA polymerase sigma-70 factor (ECF subfamily)
VAEDLTAVTFERAWRHRKRYRKGRAAFSTWLLAIARNVARDHFRRQRRDSQRQGPGDPVDVPLPLEEVADRRDDVARLLALLAGLPERDRDPVALKYRADMMNRTIAAITGLCESNVGTILHRIVTRLRQEWEGER